MTNFLHDVKNALDRYTYQVAIERLKQAQQEIPISDPLYIAVLTLLGHALSALGRSVQAYDVFEQARQLQLFNVEALVGQAEILTRLTLHEQAMERCQAAISAAPDMPRTYATVAVIYKNWERYQDALYMLEKARDFDIHNEFPGGIDCYFGDVFLCMGNGKRALDCYARSLEANPDNPLFWLHQGYAFWKACRLPDTRLAYEKAVSLAPEYHNAQFCLGSVTLAAQDYSQAEVAFRSAIDCNDDYLDAYRGLKNVQWRTWRCKEALQIRTQCQELQAQKKRTENALIARLRQETS